MFKRSDMFRVLVRSANGTSIKGLNIVRLISNSPRCLQFDMNMWLRTCEEEITEPLTGKVTGEIPNWLRGSLIRNGPGATQIGETSLNHVFDGPAFLHRFAIQDGDVSYNCRFLQSNSYKRNRAANRLVITEFGTKSVPDPCRTIFERFSSFFNQMENISDNASISVYPFGDELYAFSEAPNGYLHRIDPETLETLEQRQLIQTLLVHHTSHPHVMPNGDVYNVGIYRMDKGLRHAVVRFPFTEKGDMFKSAEIVGSFEPRWPLHPAYMHSFGVSENYFVLIEHPMSIAVPDSLMSQITNRPHRSILKEYPEHETQIVVIHRKTGEVKRYLADTIFFLHTINCHEENGKLMIDLCSYKDTKQIDMMYVDVIKKMYTDPKYKSWSHTRPKRLEIPLDAPESTKVQTHLLADVGCELPTLNYKQHNGKPYNYFYGVVTEIDSDFAGAIAKVNVKSGEVSTWQEGDCSPSEAIFVPRPNAQSEDDGVLLSVLLQGKEEKSAQLLVLDASSLKEVGRAYFTTPSSVPKCFHGWFLNK